MDTKYAIGIDVGATNFRLGVVSDDGKIHKKYMAKVGRKRMPEDIVALLTPHIKNLKNDWPVILGVGVGIPGIVETNEGVVCESPHYPEWANAPFRGLFSKAFGLPVFLDNDANMIALGESWLGAGKKLNNFIMLTLGTGVGGAIVCGKKVWHGDHGFAGEVGHILVDFNGPRCNCGSRGCLEMYASKIGLRHLVTDSDNSHKDKFLKLIKGDVDSMTPTILYEQAKDGDIFASIIWKKFGTYLGAGLATLVNTLGIDNIIIGGGISSAWDFFIAEALKELSKRTYKKTASLVKIHKAILGDDAGIVGSAQCVIS